jgi:hypothetical protein
LKIDTEGHDFNVLKGAERMLRNNSIAFIYFEFNDFIQEKSTNGGSLNEITEYLCNNINLSLEVLDNIYSSILEGNYKIFTIFYEKINKIILINRLEILNRINEITVILKLIYKLVLKEDLNFANFDLQEFINMISIISIIKLKIDDILKSKNITDCCGYAFRLSIL